MDTKFTEQESLAVINEMISRARNNVQKGAANSIIFNGYIVAFVAVANFALIHLLPETAINYSFNVWWLMLVSNVVNYFIRRKIDRSKIVKTQIDGIINSIWRGFSISVTVLLAILFAMAIFNPYEHENYWIYFALITPTITLMTGMGEFVMAKACRFKPFHWGAISFWAGSILCLLSYVLLKKGDIQFLILAACMITGFVIPGYSLNKKAKQNV